MRKYATFRRNIGPLSGFMPEFKNRSRWMCHLPNPRRGREVFPRLIQDRRDRPFYGRLPFLLLPRPAAARLLIAPAPESTALIDP